MPYTNEFIQNYVGYQLNPAKLFVNTPYDGTPLAGTLFANSESVASPFHDPAKDSNRRLAIGVAYNFVISHNDNVGTVFSSTNLSPLPRFIVTYNELFSPWNENDAEPNQQLLVTFDPVVIDNTTSQDISFRGVELIHCPLNFTDITDLETDVPLVFNFTREADSTDPAAPYVYSVNNFSGRIPLFSRFQNVLSPFNNVIQTYYDLPAGVLVTSDLLGSANVGETEDAYFMGVYSVARYNFPETILLLPGENINFNPGTIALNFDASAAIC